MYLKRFVKGVRHCPRCWTRSCFPAVQRYLFLMTFSSFILYHYWSCYTVLYLWSLVIFLDGFIGAICWGQGESHKKTRREKHIWDAAADHMCTSTETGTIQYLTFLYIILQRHRSSTKLQKKKFNSWTSQICIYNKIHIFPQSWTLTTRYLNLVY